MQETCLRAYRAFDRFDGQHCRAWLLTILRHTYVSQWRHDGHGRERIVYSDETEADGVNLFSNGLSAEDEVMAHVFAEDLERALASLPSDSRLMLLLAYVEESSYAEIAQVMDCPIGTVMSRLHRARRQLEVALAPTRRAELASRAP